MKKKSKLIPLLINNVSDNTKKDTSPIIPQRSKFKGNLSIFNRELTTKQLQFLEIAGDKDTKIMFVSGPAGTAKTYLSVLHTLKMIDEKRVSDLIYVRSAVECSDSKLGFLPGLVSEKLAPYIQPLMDKLEELLPKNEINVLMKEERIAAISIGFLRGLNWNAKAIILDEAQNCTNREILTFITRVGNFSKVFVLGDPSQADINGKSGFLKMFNIFGDDESKQNGIVTFQFTEKDIVRSKLVQFIIEKIRKTT